MLPLNLPQYQFRFQKFGKDLQIFDSIRKKFVALTPEEWVRQNFIQYLIQEKKYPPSLISVETGLIYNRLKKRSDITIYDRVGNVWMLIECKSYKVKISQNTFSQIAVYNMAGRTKTKFLAVTNGLKHYCCEIDDKNGNYHFLNEFPEYPGK